MSDQTPAPGWYPAPHANNEQRYWDGTRWLESTPASALPGAGTTSHTIAGPGAPQHPSEAAPARRSKKTAWIIGGSIAAGVLLIGGIGSALGAGTKAPVVNEKPTAAAVEEADEEPVAPTMVAVPDVTGMTATDAATAITAAGLVAPSITSFEDPLAKVVSTSPAANSEAEEGSDVSFTLEEKPKLTLAQENVIGKAKDYLSFMGFSRTGLIQQLEFEGFTTDEAAFGADNAGADWNAECAEKTKAYLDTMSFSRQGLYDQLAFEGFQPAEIDFGLAAVGY
jgi:hypothetical protein